MAAGAGWVVRSGMPAHNGDNGRGQPGQQLHTMDGVCTAAMKSSQLHSCLSLAYSQSF